MQDIYFKALVRPMSVEGGREEARDMSSVAVPKKASASPKGNIDAGWGDPSELTQDGG